MTTKQKIALGLVAGATVISGLYGVGAVKAATDSTSLFPRGVQAIVEKYNLNTDEVKAVLDEDRAQNHEEREVAYTDALNKAVTDGKITEAQKTAILAKHDEIATKREEVRTLANGERGEKMRELRTEMHDFLESEGIDESILPEPEGQGGGFGGGMHRGMNR